MPFTLVAAAAVVAGVPPNERGRCLLYDITGRLLTVVDDLRTLTALDPETLSL